MSEHHDPNFDQVMHEQKRTITTSLCQRIELGTGRSLTPIERRAIAFLLEQNWENVETEEAFLARACHVTTAMEARDLAIAIRKAIQKTVEREFEKRQTQHTNDANILAKLSAMRDLYQFSKESVDRAIEAGSEQVSLGAVPEHWLPTWARMSL